MGVDSYVICETHLEELYLGGLQFLEPWVRKLVESDNIMCVPSPSPLTGLRYRIKKFKDRHNTDTCHVMLVDDHGDYYLEPGLDYYHSVSDYNDPLLTKEERDKYILEKRDALIEQEMCVGQKAVDEMKKLMEPLEEEKESK